MDKCASCGKWEVGYYPQAEESRCSACGFTAKIPYDEYIKAKNVINNLSYPRKSTSP